VDPPQFFAGGGGAENNSVILAGRIKSYFTSRTHDTIFNRIRQVASTAQEWVTIALGCIPTAVIMDVVSVSVCVCVCVCVWSLDNVDVVAGDILCSAGVRYLFHHYKPSLREVPTMISETGVAWVLVYGRGVN